MLYPSEFASGGLRRYRVDAIMRGYRLLHEVRPEVSSFVLPRESLGRLVAYLCSHTRDVGSAEDAVSDALVEAATVAEAKLGGINRDDICVYQRNWAVRKEREVKLEISGMPFLPNYFSHPRAFAANSMEKVCHNRNI